jgi:Flp pilus assembly protein TadB
MSNPTRGLVYSLLAAISLLVLGLAVLVWVDSRRVRRYTNEIQDLHYRLDSQEVELRRFRKRLAPTDVPTLTPKPDSLVAAPKQAGDGWD